MQLYCKNSTIIATHDDAQDVPASAYGDGVYILTVPDGTQLPRLGDAPTDGQLDKRPLAVPKIDAAMMKGYVAAKRYAIETGGITVAGAHVATDRASQSMITGAVVRAQLDPASTASFKAESGFVTLTATQMLGVGVAVAAHVQACFAAEAAVLAKIESGAIKTLADVDAATWPSNA